jgi:hypothetical protein
MAISTQVLIGQNPKVLEKLTKVVEKSVQKKTLSGALPFALGTLYSLAFKAENKPLIKQLPGLLGFLKTLSASQDFSISKSSKGIMYLLGELSLEQEDDGKSPNGPNNFDVMISYNWVCVLSCFPPRLLTLKIMLISLVSSSFFWCRVE